MNNIMLRIRKRFVNKKENTRKLKYETLLEENKNKNKEIIDLLYERIDLKEELKEKNEEIERLRLSMQGLQEKIDLLEEKKAELLHENEELRTKKTKRSVKNG